MKDKYYLFTSYSYVYFCLLFCPNRVFILVINILSTCVLQEVENNWQMSDFICKNTII